MASDRKRIYRNAKPATVVARSILSKPKVFLNGKLIVHDEPDHASSWQRLERLGDGDTGDVGKAGFELNVANGNADSQDQIISSCICVGSQDIDIGDTTVPELTKQLTQEQVFQDALSVLGMAIVGILVHLVTWKSQTTARYRASRMPSASDLKAKYT